MKTFRFKNYDKTITAYKWIVPNSKGVIQIIHGMGEHAKRYHDYAGFLNKSGYSVYACDHRGHGMTLEPHEHHGEIGHDGFNKIIEDQYLLSQIIKQENEWKPLIILGHSMGSFILQEYLARYGHEIDKAIISGSGKIGSEVKIGKIIAKTEMKLRKQIKGSKILDILSFGLFNKKYEDQRTNQDWLSRDSKEVDKYIADEFCGNMFPAQFYYYFYDMLANLNTPDKLNKLPKDLPILIFSGDMDPVGNYGKGTKKLHDVYIEAELKNTNLILYPNGRHEMLNEINKTEVYNDTLNFIETNF